MNTRKILIIVTIIFFIATLAFIWGHSMQSISESQKKSLSVAMIITPFIEIFVGQGNVTDHLVRKMGHFIEFALLGGVLALLTVFLRRVNIQMIVNCLFVGLAVAVTDETIQIFFNRGSQVSDILLDFSSVASGIFAVMLLRWIINRAKSHKRS